jgi:hypothetical protein
MRARNSSIGLVHGDWSFMARCAWPRSTRLLSPVAVVVVVRSTENPVRNEPLTSDNFQHLINIEQFLPLPSSTIQSGGFSLASTASG